MQLSSILLVVVPAFIASRDVASASDAALPEAISSVSVIDNGGRFLRTNELEESDDEERMFSGALPENIASVAKKLPRSKSLPDLRLTVKGKKAVDRLVAQLTRSKSLPNAELTTKGKKELVAEFITAQLGKKDL
ncbi:putative secreted RxLR effector protein [Phytophthora cinnamomi]|uniref:putative secreted RxLR effector protein n=1 Tax=Phytophthora cinnamomi TaxID=4785 RepID=UPI00355A415C|nr:putative secreted RxLR effector protein [Phytophthora cinnamomi]